MKKEMKVLLKKYSTYSRQRYRDKKNGQCPADDHDHSQVSDFPPVN